MSTSEIDKLLDAMANINLNASALEIQRLRSIEAWARRQLRIEYAAGDRVVIVSTGPMMQASERTSGWHGYMHELAPGKIGVAKRIEYNDYLKRWYVLVELTPEGEEYGSCFSMELDWVERAPEV